MNFLTTPLSFTRDQRTSRDVCRDACAIEGPAPRTPDTAVWISLAIGAVAVALVLIFN